MKVTITGASGFVGQNLSQYLKSKNCYVHAISLRGLWSINEDCEAIIHLAGKAHDTSNTSKPEEYFKINRDLTIQLFDEFLNSGVKDFFYFSSVKAAADIVEGILDENHKANPKTPYGKSKLEAENYLLGQKLPEGKRLFIIRPCMIHGPGNKGNLNLLYKMVEKGLPWPLGDFENKRSFLSIDNLCFLVNEMLKNKSIGSGIYNFADDEAISTNDLIHLINNVLGKKAKLWKVPKPFIERLAKAGDFLKLPLNTERLKKLTESYVVSNNKIKQTLGITKLVSTSHDGLEKTIKSFSSL